MNAHSGTDGFMFLVGDQPYLSASTIDALISVFDRDKSRIVIPTYGGTKGNPVIFPSTLKNELLSLDGDQGGRLIIERMQHPVNLVAINRQMEAIDVDTADDYEMVRDASG